MAHISPIEAHTTVQYVSVGAILFFCPLIYKTSLPLLPHRLISGCLGSYPNEEFLYTTLSDHGWSSVGGWAIAGSQPLSK